MDTFKGKNKCSVNLRYIKFTFGFSILIVSFITYTDAMLLGPERPQNQVVSSVAFRTRPHDDYELRLLDIDSADLREQYTAIAPPQVPISRSWQDTINRFLRSDWFLSFSAEIVANVVLAIVLYLAITNPREQRRVRKRKSQLLGMLKSEIETNRSRVNTLITLLEPIEDIDGKPFLEKLRLRKFTDITEEEGQLLGQALPRKYTRGVWNALKEDGFITQLEDPLLVFYLLRANEALVVAESSRKALRDKLLKGETDIDADARRALFDSKNLRHALGKVLEILGKAKFEEFISGEIPIDEDN